MTVSSTTTSPASAPSPVTAGASDLTALIAAAIATTLGGAAIVGTRFLVGQTDPITLAFLRYGIAALSLLPFVLFSSARHVSRRDILPIVGLGLLYFCMHPWAFTAALKYTTAAYGALVLSFTPMLTMILSSLVGYEKITPRKFAGIFLALLGVVAAVSESAFASSAGPMAWFGNLIMLAAAAIGATYNVLSRPVLKQNSATTVISYGMAAGAIGLTTLLLGQGTDLTAIQFDMQGWIIVVCLGVFGAALAFYLLVWALKRTTPTRVAVFLALNPVVAMLLGAFVLNEPVTHLQLIGLAMVLTGIFAVNWQPKA